MDCILYSSLSSLPTTHSALHYMPLTHIHTLMAETAMQVSNHSHKHTHTLMGTAFRSNLEFSILPKDTWTYRLEEPGIEPLIFRDVFLVCSLSEFVVLKNASLLVIWFALNHLLVKK